MAKENSPKKPINEGMEKRGGVGTPPKTVKPAITPKSQNPPPKKDK